MQTKQIISNTIEDIVKLNKSKDHISEATRDKTYHSKFTNFHLVVGWPKFPPVKSIKIEPSVLKAHKMQS
ncbi:hypothetical protein SLEP1_g54891 [Rubroshorea leprosula]|uniref:Uncharacterized protein n=1 Tax=Rubroshorea leprosula TaxID=152421 RepID=A0AAV5MGY2_9ROSI|nr:hypothetical protein SLEP1_g54891 [Rubroshorea leprosula]